MFINCVYLKFNNPTTGSLDHIHSIPISYSYWDTSGIFLAKFHNPSSFQGNFMDFFFNVNLEKRLFSAIFCHIISVFRLTLNILLNLIPPSQRVCSQAYMYKLS